MKRPLFNLASLFCAFAVLGLGVLWIDSYSAQSGIGFRLGAHAFYASAHPGVVVLGDSWNRYVPPGSKRFSVDRTPYGIYPSVAPEVAKMLAARHLRLGPTTPQQTPGWHGFAIEHLRIPVSAGVLPNGLSVPASTTHHVRLYLPMWVYAVALCIIPGCNVLLRWRGRRRLNEGRCVSCGYDLRGTPEKCPECGAAPRLGSVVGSASADRNSGRSI